MENPGIQSIAESIQFIPQLQELFIYQNTLRKEGLHPLFIQLLKHCNNLVSFDLCDNFVREEATTEMTNIIKNCENLRNLNLSDCLNEGENEAIITAFEESKNRNFERLGFNFIELDKDLALRLLEVVNECPNLKRLDITGNDFSKSTKKKFTEAFEDKPEVLSKFDDDDDEEEVTRLFEELKI
jgi:Ran GTPase-activating protein (RanGAP) involved in mRNA processing and transport